MCEHQNIETPKIECARDDSGYLTNTPISCEQVDSINGSHVLEMAITMDIGETPTATGNKLNRLTLNTMRKLDGILTDSRKPSGNDGFQSKLKNSSITSIIARKRIDSLPNLFLGDRNTRVEFSSEVHSRFRPLRLLSVDSVTDTLMYQGWIGLDFYEASVSTDQRIDFVKQLCAQGFLAAIAIQIFRYLQPKDLLSASKVSVLWKQMIKQDVVLANTLRMHNAKLKYQLSADEASKENTFAEVGSSIARRSSCTDIMNIVMERSKGGIFRPPLAPAVRFEEEARKNGHWLRLCPKCSHPAQVEDCASVAQCLRDGCGNRFCLKCRCKVHGNRKCLVEVQDSPIKIIIGGKKSKNNLKRL